MTLLKLYIQKYLEIFKSGQVNYAIQVFILTSSAFLFCSAHNAMIPTSSAQACRSYLLQPETNRHVNKPHDTYALNSALKAYVSTDCSSNWVITLSTAISRRRST